MVVVHHLENSRSQRILWLLEELGLDYEVKRYERDPRTLLAPKALRDVHPLGKSPVVEIDGEVIAETGAIVEDILERVDDTPLRPPAGSAQARRVRFWTHHAEGSAMTPLVLKLIFSEMPRRAPRLARPLVKAMTGPVQSGFIDPQIARLTRYWNSELSKSEWFAGPTLTVADIMMSFPLEAAASRGDLTGLTHVDAFLDRVHARPAYQRALQAGGPYAYA